MIKKERFVNVESCEIYTLEEFFDLCINGVYLDSDGFCYLGNGEFFDISSHQTPSSFCRLYNSLIGKSTHVSWFNN